MVNTNVRILRKAVFLAANVICSTLVAAVTNVQSLVGCQLSSSVLSNICTRDCSSVDSVFLGSLKAQVLGNLTDAVYYFDTNLALKVVGVETFDQVPLSLERKFHDKIVDVSAANYVLLSFFTTNVSDKIFASGKISSLSNVHVQTNEFCYVIQHLGEKYRVCDVIIDGASICED